MAKAHTLVDNFNDNTLDTSVWAAFPNADAARETNGRVEMRPPSNQGTTVMYLTGSTYDLTDSEVHVELVRVPSNPVARMPLTAFAGSLGYISIWVFNGRLECLQWANSTLTILRSIPYDHAAHRWLRLSERAGTTRWEVSASGQEWTVIHQAANPISLTAVQLAFGFSTSAHPSPGLAVFDNFNVQNTDLSRRVEQRRLSARDVRVQAAQVAAERRHEEHANNNDEANYPDQPLIGNYSKGLRHDALGDPEPGSYTTLLRALQSEDPADFEEITLGVLPPETKRQKLTNPQAGLAFDIAGPDAQERTMPPAPSFGSEVAAHEAGELYWMAVARDVSFTTTRRTPPSPPRSPR